jgi:hypothetical protein
MSLIILGYCQKFYGGILKTCLTILNIAVIMQLLTLIKQWFKKCFLVVIVKQQTAKMKNMLSFVLSICKLLICVLTTHHHVKPYYFTAAISLQLAMSSHLLLAEINKVKVEPKYINLVDGLGK